MLCLFALFFFIIYLFYLFIHLCWSSISSHIRKRLKYFTSQAQLVVHTQNTNNMLRAVTASQPILARHLHTSRATQDLFDFFRRKKISETTTPSANAVEKTKDVMKKLEEGGKTGAEASEKDADIGKSRKLRILGAPVVEDAWQTEKVKFAFRPWPLQQTNKDRTSEDVTAAIANLSVADINASFSSIDEKFSFVKNIGKELRVSIPDPVVSRLNSVAEFQAYLCENVVDREFDERQPDAIYLDAKDFEGTNISIKDAITERYNKKQKFRDALRQAKREEKRTQDELIRQSLAQ